MESDIDPQSGFRLPLLKRDDLDDVGKQTYDEAVTPGRSIAGLQGPAGVQLYAGKALPHLRTLTKYLRTQAGFSARIREIAILAVARELDSQVQWTMHEEVALKEGIEPAVVDVIRHRKSTDSLDKADAAVIDLGRGATKFGYRNFAIRDSWAKFAATAEERRIFRRRDSLTPR